MSNDSSSIVEPNTEKSTPQVEPQTKVSTSKVEEEAPRITAKVKTGKPKNPNRVAAGKRAAQLSKEARERAKREQEADEEEVSSTIYYPLAIGATVVSVLGERAYSFSYVHPCYHNLLNLLQLQLLRSRRHQR